MNVDIQKQLNNLEEHSPYTQQAVVQKREIKSSPTNYPEVWTACETLFRAFSINLVQSRKSIIFKFTESPMISFELLSGSFLTIMLEEATILNYYVPNSSDKTCLEQTPSVITMCCAQ